MNHVRSTLLLATFAGLAACAPKSDDKPTPPGPGLSFESFGVVAGFEAGEPVAKEDAWKLQESFRPASCRGGTENARVPTELKVGAKAVTESRGDTFHAIESLRIIKIETDKIVYGKRYLSSKLTHPLYTGPVFTNDEIEKTCVRTNEQGRDGQPGYTRWECGDENPPFVPEIQRIIRDNPALARGEDCSTEYGNYENEKREYVKGTYLLDGVKREALLEKSEIAGVQVCKAGERETSRRPVIRLRVSVAVKGLLSLDYPSCYGNEAHSEWILLDENRQIIADESHRRSVLSGTVAE